MIIDMHTHIFPSEIIAHRTDFARRDPWFAELYGNPKARMATAEDLVAAMDRHDITLALTCGFGWRDAGIIRLANDYIIDAVKRYQTRLIGLAVVQPIDVAGTFVELARCSEVGLRGIGELMPHGQGYRLNDMRVMTPIMEAAMHYQLLVMTHSSEPVGHLYPGKGDALPSDLLALITAFPTVHIIAAHWGGGLPFYHLMPEVAALTQNCWYDTAASPYLYRPDIFRIVGATVGHDKILWATDFPLMSYSPMLAYTAQAGMDAATSAMVMGENAAQLLGIPVK